MLATFGASAIVSALMLAYELFAMPETLTKDSRRPFTGLVNPFGAVARLFTTTNPTLSKLISLNALGWCVEAKNYSTASSLYNMNTLGMSVPQMATVTSMVGAGYIAQAPITQTGLRFLGQYRFTSVCYYATMLSFMIRGGIQKIWAPYVAQVVNFVGEGRGNASKAMASDIANSLGLGRGEFSGALSSLRALVAVVVPLLYGLLYNIGDRIRVPGLPFFGVVRTASPPSSHRRPSARRSGLSCVLCAGWVLDRDGDRRAHATGRAQGALRS